MAYDYNRIINNVARPQIKRFGTQIKLTRKEDDSVNWVKEYDPETMGYTWVNKNTGAESTDPPGETIKEYYGYAVITRFKEQFYDNSTVEAGDKKLLAIDVPAPRLGDVITVGGTDYAYVYHNTLAPSGEPVVYTIQVRI